MVLSLALERIQRKGKPQYLWVLIRSIAVLPWPILHWRDIGVQLSGYMGTMTDEAQIQTQQLAIVCLHIGLKRATLGCREVLVAGPLLSFSMKTPGTLVWVLATPRSFFCPGSKVTSLSPDRKKQLWVQQTMVLRAMREMGSAAPGHQCTSNNIGIYGVKLPFALLQQNLFKFNGFQKSADTAVHPKTADFNAFSTGSWERREKGLFCLKILSSGDMFKMCLST